MRLILALALALVAQSNGSGGPGDRWQNIDGTPGFAKWRKFVRSHVKRYATHRVNHLCGIVGIDVVPGQADDRDAYFYWPEQHTIEILSASDDPSMPDDLSELLFQRGPIQLDKDIIDPKQEVNLDPNTVSRSWVNSLIARCRNGGTQITITKGR